MDLVRAVITACVFVVPVLGHAEDSNPVSVNAILAAQPFKLAEAYRDTWGLDTALISGGTLLVLDVDPKLLNPTDARGPVLYVAGRPTVPLNDGDASGHILVIVRDDVDVTGSLMWFGAPDLPEALTADEIRAELDEAKKLLAGPPGKPRSVRRAVEARDLASLLRDTAAPLVDEFSPQDADVADMWRLPEGD